MAMKAEPYRSAANEEVRRDRIQQHPDTNSRGQAYQRLTKAVPLLRMPEVYPARHPAAVPDIPVLKADGTQQPSGDSSAMIRHVVLFVLGLMLLSTGTSVLAEVEPRSDRERIALNLQKWFFRLRGDLEEVQIWGGYTRENEIEVPQFEEELRFLGSLKEGESAGEEYAHLNLGQERYLRAGQAFCFSRTADPIREKAPVIDKNVRMRLYDREGNLLSEEFVRDEFPESSDWRSFEWNIVAYVPYHEQGHEIRVVRLDGNEEIVLEQLPTYALEELLYHAYVKRSFYAYHYQDGCFVSPPTHR